MQSQAREKHLELYRPIEKGPETPHRYTGDVWTQLVTVVVVVVVVVGVWVCVCVVGVCVCRCACVCVAVCPCGWLLLVVRYCWSNSLSTQVSFE